MAGEQAPVNIVCMKWGTLYGPEYANRLYAMTARNLNRPFRFVCFTDDPAGLRDEIEPMELPPISIDSPYENTPWKKLALYNPTLGDLEGPTLFFDLDILITGSLDKFFDHPGDYCVIHNWTQPKQINGNTSVFRFTIGAHSDLLDLFHSKSTQHWVDTYRIEQTFLSQELHKQGKLVYWPKEWCASFKVHCLPGGWKIPGIFLNWFKDSKLPDNASVCVFHGHPNPDDALAGRWPGKWYKRLKPAHWIADHWHE
ncbi:MAG: hypothetical protein N4A65_06405 [Cohaesibacter sp.]|jgi:hypothetical protein|nr:hypothetical protein [Cohaesibacter sp.]